MTAYDVVVVGGGNAALVAAMSARHVVESVLLVERAPTWLRGGNSRHTRDIRYAHPPGEAYTTGEAYPVDELMDDLLRVGGGHNERMAQLVVEGSCGVAEFMTAHGVRWQEPLTGTLHLSRTNRFFLGGGKALINTYYQTAEAMGIDVQYETSVEEIVLDGANQVNGVVIERAGAREEIAARAVVVASGGFEANLDWLRRYWGDAVDNYVIRGTPYNDGRVLANLLDKGAATAGDPKGFHAVALDARSPKFDGGIATRLDSVPFGIAVNKFGKRFYDEGEEFWPKRYAIWGRWIAEQSDQIAYSFVDSQTIDCFLTSLYRPYEGQTIGEVAEMMGLDPLVVTETVREFNAAIVPGGTFNPGILDNCRTEGLTPPKSHWAVPLRDPPFYGYPLRPGITFTYLGLAVDECCRVQMSSGETVGNLFAAGEIMSGNVLRSGYLAGFGLTIGTVFGQIAGTQAGRYARG
ncbi:MAG: FAD-dependent tricarballylate dehydrogenase TcuA [Chloroflexi bacterium]|nr:FAD-dependent tricarballylate dehydrogenase TcuA [Chloroflexota bacterium]MBV9896239.1 FAD-dependent tricarballylate dehydrogenase TcuA [Chloroflexota bacterium]